jgi:CRISPR-associated protein Cas1
MSIIHSKRTGIYLIEYCRVLVKQERVVYVTADDYHEYYWNIPIGNTSVLLLGNGTSVTQAATRMLSEDGVMLAFVGGGGTPLFLASQSEYRPTEYLQDWYPKWVDDASRLAIAKQFSIRRCALIEDFWGRLDLGDELLAYVAEPLRLFRDNIGKSNDTNTLMAAEGRFSKALYRLLSEKFTGPGFTRKAGKRDQKDKANSFLDHGNYLAYGLAGVALWVLGIPHSMPVSHGMTRRGALVFDVADIVKDGYILPLAFLYANKGARNQEFRDRCTLESKKLQILEIMITEIKRATTGQ